MPDSKEQTTWQTVYEQIQEIIDKCVVLWYYCELVDQYISHPTITCSESWITVSDGYWSWPFYFSYHDLFSKDSGIMEFVEWKDIKEEIACNVKRCWDWLDCDWSVSWTSSDRNVRTSYHYMTMWPMTAEQKVHYFVNNAIVPSKSE